MWMCKEKEFFSNYDKLTVVQKFNMQCTIETQSILFSKISLFLSYIFYLKSDLNLTLC